MTGEAHYEGRRAYEAGLHIGDCPYPFGSDDGRDWRAGHILAESNAQMAMGLVDRRSQEMLAPVQAEYRRQRMRTYEADAIIEEACWVDEPEPEPDRPLTMLGMRVLVSPHIATALALNAFAPGAFHQYVMDRAAAQTAAEEMATGISQLAIRAGVTTQSLQALSDAFAGPTGITTAKPRPKQRTCPRHGQPVGQCRLCWR